MSVDEMKIAAIKKITDLNDEAQLKEILEHLEKIQQNTSSNITAIYADIKLQYSAVLQKMTQ